MDARGATYLRQQARGQLQAGTLRNFRALNRIGKEAPLNDNLPISASYALIEAGQVKKEGWNGLKQRFSQAEAILWVSQVGFNGQRDQALVYLEAVGENKSGIGTYFLLQKTDGAWEILAQVRGWIA